MWSVRSAHLNDHFERRRYRLTNDLVAADFRGRPAQRRTSRMSQPSASANRTADLLFLSLCHDVLALTFYMSDTAKRLFSFAKDYFVLVVSRISLLMASAASSTLSILPPLESNHSTFYLAGPFRARESGARSGPSLSAALSLPQHTLPALPRSLDSNQPIHQLDRKPASARQAAVHCDWLR
jgi:hypothetical protein